MCFCPVVLPFFLLQPHYVPSPAFLTESIPDLYLHSLAQQVSEHRDCLGTVNSSFSKQL